jgi:uncharacterized protein with PQ loop repeat
MTQNRGYPSIMWTVIGLLINATMAMIEKRVSSKPVIIAFQVLVFALVVLWAFVVFEARESSKFIR